MRFYVINFSTQQVHEYGTLEETEASVVTLINCGYSTGDIEVIKGEKMEYLFDVTLVNPD